MNKQTIIFTILLCFFLNCLFGQDTLNDDRPYLSDEDIRSLEAILPDDIPKDQELFSDSNDSQEQAIIVETAEQEKIDAPEPLPKANDTIRLYQLFVLNLNNGDANADIDSAKDSYIAYKYKDSDSGYLIVLYTIPKDGPVFSVFPAMPKGAVIVSGRITKDVITLWRYINEFEFMRLIPNNDVLTEIKNVLR